MKFSWKRALVYCAIFFTVTFVVHFLHASFIPEGQNNANFNNPNTRAISLVVPLILSIIVWVWTQKGPIELLLANLVAGGSLGLGSFLVSFVVSLPLIWLKRFFIYYFLVLFQKDDKG